MAQAMEPNQNVKNEELQSKIKMRDDEQFNMSFVKKVEDYKCLYDYTRSDYKNIQIQDKAWQEIADEFNETRKFNKACLFGFTIWCYFIFIATNCKERWRNLRGCYTRHLKQILTPGMRMRKPYYLAESMSFIHPFTKTRTHHIISPPVNEIVIKADGIDAINSTLLNECDSEDVDGDHDEAIDNTNNVTATLLPHNKLEHSSYQIISKDNHHVIVAASTPMVTNAAQTTPMITTSQHSENSLKRKLFDTSDSYSCTSTATFPKIQTIESPFFEIKAMPSHESSEADMFFLKSLLPDIAFMNQAQKRRLRIQILSIIDNILSEG